MIRGKNRTKCKFRAKAQGYLLLTCFRRVINQEVDDNVTQGRFQEDAHCICRRVQGGSTLHLVNRCDKAKNMQEGKLIVVQSGSRLEKREVGDSFNRRSKELLAKVPMRSRRHSRLLGSSTRRSANNHRKSTTTTTCTEPAGDGFSAGPYRARRYGLILPVRHLFRSRLNFDVGLHLTPPGAVLYNSRVLILAKFILGNPL